MITAYNLSYLRYKCLLYRKYNPSFKAYVHLSTHKTPRVIINNTKWEAANITGVKKSICTNYKTANKILTDLIDNSIRAQSNKLRNHAGLWGADRHALIGWIIRSCTNTALANVLGPKMFPRPVTNGIDAITFIWETRYLELQFRTYKHSDHYLEIIMTDMEKGSVEMYRSVDHTGDKNDVFDTTIAMKMINRIGEELYEEQLRLMMRL